MSASITLGALFTTSSCPRCKNAVQYLTEWHYSDQLAFFHFSAQEAKCLRTLRGTRKAALAQAAVLASLFAIAAFARQPVIAAGGLLLWAISWGVAPVGTQLWRSSETRHAPEAAQSMNTSVFQLSIMVGSLIGAVVVDRVSLHALVWFAAAVFGLALAVALLARRLDRSPAV